MNRAGIVLHVSASAQLDDFLKAPSHALLLSGPVGIGKTHIAHQLARELLGAGDSSLENHAYFRVVIPQDGTIAIEQVRELSKFFRLSVPGTAKIKRVAVLQDAETMGREAQNALLKLLEEPPEGSLLVLTSSYPDQLLPTVRSRTQLLMLAPPEQASLQEHFKALSYDDGAIARALLRAGSNVAQAAQLLALGENGADESLQLVKQVLTGTPYDRLVLVDGLAKQKEQLATFMATLNAIAFASLQTAAQKNPASLARWHTILEATAVAQAALERNGNAKLVLTELMLAL